jgi:predicted DNA binding CopG/RHH family protein
MKKKSKLKPIPKFRNEDEEREFWHIHDSTDYIDYSKANRVTIKFDPSVEEPVKLISIRLPREMLNKLKAMATKRDVPYQSLIKMILAEKLEKAA